MANRRKPHKKRSRQSSTSGTAVAPAPQVLPAGEKGLLRRGVERVFNSAIDAALDNIWPIIGGFLWSALVTAAVAMFWYFSKAPWLYSVLKYAVAFAAGSLWIFLVLSVLALLGYRRRLKKDRLPYSQYVSTAKGYLDYQSELKPAGRRFQETTSEIAREMGRGSKLAMRIAAILPYLEFSPLWARRFISLAARYYRKHALRLERLTKRLERTGTTVAEVNQGVLQWAPTASQGNRDQLVATQQALIVADEALSQSITSLKNYRNLAIPVKNISRDMGTAVNYLVAVVDRHVAILEQIQNDYGECFKVLASKLSS